MENDEKEFDYAEFANKIKAEVPVHIINLDGNSVNAVTGMYLMTKENVLEYMENLIGDVNLKDDSILVFEPRHVMECCQILYACLVLLKARKCNIDIDNIIDRVIKLTLSHPIRYKYFMQELYKIYDDIKPSDSNDHTALECSVFSIILIKVWFLSYANIDAIGKEGLDEFTNNEKGNTKNE
jgi:hypothetical protein